MRRLLKLGGGVIFLRRGLPVSWTFGLTSASCRLSGRVFSISLTAAAVLSAYAASAEDFPSIAQYFPMTLAQLPPTAASRSTPAPAGDTPRPLPSVTGDLPQSGAQAARAGGNAAAAEAPGFPDLQRELADADVGGLRESISSVPSIVGDGCNPGGAGSGGKVTIDRLVIFGENMTVSGQTLSGVQPAVIYEFPQDFRDIQSLPTNPPGVVPGAIPVGSIAGTPSFQVEGVPPGGANTIVGPSAGYAATVEADLKQTFIDRTGVDSGQVVYTPASSGALTDGTDYDAFAYYNYVVDAASTTPGLNVGFVKLAENVSPLPRDRVFFNMSYFHNSFFSQDVRADINRFMPGFEKTFFDGFTSIEIRTPFAATLDSTQSYDASAGTGITSYRNVELGNMSVIFKGLIKETKTSALTGGLMVQCPTAQAIRIKSVGLDQDIARGKDLVYVENESVHVMPFTGFIWAPNDRFFAQTLLQIDCDTNGNPAYANVLLTDDIKQQGNYAGRLTYPTYMYLGLSTGYWIYRNNSRSSGLTGIAPLLEMHYNQSLSSYDVICQPGFQLGEDPGSLSLINGMTGLNLEWGSRSTLTVAYVSPIGGGADRWFDGEARVMYNWRFGPQNRLTRVQF
jgi:hypothetical protein